MTAPRTLLPYQARWVGDAAPLKIAEKSRRIGLSWAEAYDAVVHAGAGKGNVTYQSYDKEMTRGSSTTAPTGRVFWRRAPAPSARAFSTSVIPRPCRCSASIWPRARPSRR